MRTNPDASDTGDDDEQNGAQPDQCAGFDTTEMADAYPGHRNSERNRADCVATRKTEPMPRMRNVDQIRGGPGRPDQLFNDAVAEPHEDSAREKECFRRGAPYQQERAKDEGAASEYPS